MYVETPSEVSWQVQSKPKEMVYFTVGISYSPWWILKFSTDSEGDWNTAAQKSVRGA